MNLSGKFNSYYLIIIVCAFVFTSVLSFQVDDCEKAKIYYEKAVQTYDWVKKEAYYKKAIELCPTFAEAHNNLADVYEKAEKYEEAIKEYQIAAELKPSLIEPRISLGDIFFKFRDYKSAIKKYEIVLQLKPECEDAQSKIKIAREKLESRGLVKSDEFIDTLSKPYMITMGPEGITRSEPRIAVTIYFASDSAEILPESYPQLKEVGEALNSPQLAPYRFIIEGHTDSTGEAENNLELSKKRAQSVKDYLLSNYSIDPGKLEIIGYGQEKPVASNETPQGRALNRRVEFVRIVEK